MNEIESIQEICSNLENNLPLTTREILADFDLLNGHPWSNHASSPITTYYACLYSIAKISDPKRILEIGTAFGMSGASLIKACDNFELFVTIDLGTFSEEYGFKENNISYAKNKIQNWCKKYNIPIEKTIFFQANTQPFGKTDNTNKPLNILHWKENQELMNLLLPDSFDVLFIDGKHTEDGLYNDMKSFWQFLKPGGILLCDDLHDPETYKGIFPWAGDTLNSYNKFINEFDSDITEHYIWNFPHVLPDNFRGLRPFGIIRKKIHNSGFIFEQQSKAPSIAPGYFSELINNLAKHDNRLYYRDQSPESLNSLVELVHHNKPTQIIELGTLSGLSLRAWLSTDSSAKIVAIDLSFNALYQSRRILPLDLSRVKLLEQNILEVDFQNLWDPKDKVLFYIDAHDSPKAPIMDHILENALPLLPHNSLVVVDDLWFSSDRLSQDNALPFFEKNVLHQIDPLQCFKGFYAPYWKGGSFMGFQEVIPLMNWVNRNHVDLIFNPAVKLVYFKWPQNIKNI